jgi:hypothetical protein
MKKSCRKEVLNFVNIDNVFEKEREREREKAKI